MSEGVRKVLVALGSFLLVGCPAVVTDPPPPPRKVEILAAPPSALGAHAAGTDAAPRPELAMPDSDGDPAPSLEAPPPGSAVPDSGAPPPPPVDAGTPL